MDVTVGRGFCLGEDSKQDNQPIGMINVDALYSLLNLLNMMFKTHVLVK